METPQQPEPQGSSHIAASIDQMLNAAYKLSEWLNFYWNFYVVFVGVVLGWIFSAKNPWQPNQKYVVSAFFIGFAAFSIVALARTYYALYKTTLSLRNRWGHDLFKDAILANFSPRLWPAEIAMHVIADATVIYCIWTFKPGP
jgi:hypothetical protein